MKRPFLGWPGWRLLIFTELLSALVAVWFAVIYGGCDWITAHRSLRVPIALPLELSIPFVPAATVAYCSIYGLFLLGPFVLRERAEVVRLIRALLLSIALGGVGFLLLPSMPAYPPPGELGRWAGLYHWADRCNLDYNMIPSLHVALSVCCVAAFAPEAPRAGRALLWLWALAIALSTLLTHQHHLLDVITGWAVGWWSFRIIPKKDAGPLID